MFAFSRPGGNKDGGSAAPRVPLEVQQAWWTGWKKLHGMKWQTVILANGMDFQVYGPLSVRAHDRDTLRLSFIEELLALLQADDPFFFRIYGDSAYSVTEIIGVGEGRGMSSVRETVEWSYKDVKVLWKYCDYRHVLHLRNQPVAKIFFVCMLLRNAYVTLHGSQISEYMFMLPPTFEEWVAQGPSARPIPNNSIFSNNYEPPSEESSSDSDDEEEEDN